MSLWRYRAVRMANTDVAQDEASCTQGEVTGESAATVRQALRRIGLQVIDLRPIRARGRYVPRILRSHLRRRRRARRAELYDAWATMLQAGLPLAEALDATLASQAVGLGSPRAMLLAVRESVRAGCSLEAALRAHDTWFEATEIAMVAAGEQAGNLAGVLRTLAARHERSEELASRWLAALTYPAVVTVVGLGVVVFLATKTLPELVAVLEDAGVETPRPTRYLLAIGQGLAEFWPLVVLGVLVLATAVTLARRAIGRSDWIAPAWLRYFQPDIGRQLAIAHVARQWADLVASGLPLVAALGIVAPTVKQPSLRRKLGDAAARMQAGEAPDTALADERWFDAEFRRLIAVGQATGELGSLLEDLSKRYERRARRRIDQLTALIEPAVILSLAAFVGALVMAAILPLIRLQEIL